MWVQELQPNFYHYQDLVFLTIVAEIPIAKAARTTA